MYFYSVCTSYSESYLLYFIKQVLSIVYTKVINSVGFTTNPDNKGYFKVHKSAGMCLLIYNVYGHMGIDLFGEKFYTAPVVNKFTHSHHQRRESKCPATNSPRRPVEYFG